MKKITFLLLILAGNLSLLSCTADSIQEIEAELESFATEGDDESKDPPEIPEED